MELSVPKTRGIQYWDEASLMEISVITSEYGLVSPNLFPLEERLGGKAFRGQKILITKCCSVAVGKATM
jgi:hypothetical protein